MGVVMIRILVLSLLAIGLAGTSPAFAQAAAAGQDAAAKGATVYAAQKCAMCHSLDGKGMAKGPLDGVGSKLTADQIREWITHPVEMSAKANATRKPVMKAYPNLPKEDLDALVAFLAAKKK
jgi:mono/diheme cytochrome c family protein